MASLNSCFKKYKTDMAIQDAIWLKVEEFGGTKNAEVKAVEFMIGEAEKHRSLIVEKIEAAGGKLPDKNLTSSVKADTVEGKGGMSDGTDAISGNGGKLSEKEQSGGAEEADGGRRADGVPGGHRGDIRGPGKNGIPADDQETPGEIRGEGQGDEQGGTGVKRGGGRRPDRIPSEPGNYRITDADNLGKGGAKSKAKDNIKAITILKKLQETGRPATKEQQAALVKYVGWGASELANGMFPTSQYDPTERRYVLKYKEGWEDLGEKLKSLLSEKEYSEAKGSTLNAHYTSQEVINAMYRALERFGYDGNGRILEPGIGIGNFIGLLPASLSQSRFTGVEMDPITAGIAKLLYPGHDIRNADFAAFKAPNDFFDVALGNPPFLDVEVTGDPDYVKNKFLVHDFFFAKSIDKVRPGGLMMLVTSKGTMDKQNDKARSYLSKRADLIGAVRLPQTAFKENAGTEVVTDVIFLRKRKDGEPYDGKSWTEIKEVMTKGGEPVYVNEYFADHPEMVLGDHSTKGSMYGPNQYTVEPKKEAIGKLFDDAVKKLPKDIYQKDIKKTPTDEETVVAEFSPDSVKEGGFYLSGDKIMQKENGVGKPVKAEGAKKRLITDYIAVRDAVRNVLYVQLKGAGGLEEAQEALSEAYDGFVQRHGAINKARKTVRNLKDGSENVTYQYVNFTHFKSDPDAYLVSSIEKHDDESGKTSKADIFTERVISPHVDPHIETLTDALHVSLYKTGGVDMPMIAELMGVSEDDAIAGLDNIIFMDPAGSKWVTHDEYLSGNVRAKLEAAKAAAEIDSAFERNVKALEAVQPEDLPQSQIKISLGMPILDPDHIISFARQEIGMGIDVSYLPLDGSWKVEPFSGHRAAQAVSDYGTDRADAATLLEHALNGSSPKIFDRGEKDKQVLNQDATQAAIEKLKKIKDRFQSWVWDDQDRADALARRFNDLYNNTVKREYGGDYLENMQFPGMSMVKTPFIHQKRVAWRIIQRGNTYMAHSVGAGKTIASIVSGMEMKRLGIKKKPMWTVPNHMLKQFAGEFLELYPAAKIIVADEEQFAKENRNRFMGRVASENWDAIIITHSAFKMIPMSADFQQGFIDEQLAELEELLQDNQGDRMKRKQLERLKKRLEARLVKILANANKDKGVNFEETGIDQIFVDEAHEFRKLDFATNQTDIKGIDPSGSLAAFDLYVKSKYLETLYPNRSLVLMSGTPVTNTLGEIYSIQKFLQEKKLRELGLHHFDSWAATFGGMVTNIESTPAGTYKAVSRFGDLSNLKSLCAMWAEIGDFIHAKDLPYLTRPKVKGGGRQLVIGETGEIQREYKKELASRIKEIEARKGPAKKGDDIILSVITDGRHAAMDDRYIDSNAPDRPDSKMFKLLEKTFEIWERTKEQKSTQMIFADLGVPSSAEKRGFSVYAHIKAELVKKGVPENEIAFMQDYKKSAQKTKLFKAMNEGSIRFLIGSSQAMGTGVNAQKKLIALHHFDPDTYLPANIEQREGRIIRQGNENETVELYAYVARGSYDETMWQFLETKQRFIDDFLAGNVSSDTASDIDGAADSFAMARAMSSDNPLAVELAGVDNELGRLESLHRAHKDNQRNLQYKSQAAETSIPQLKGAISSLEDAISRRISTRGDSFKATINGIEYSDRSKAGESIVSLMKSMLSSKDEKAWKKTIGSLGGFTMKLSKFTPGDHVSFEVRLNDEKTDIQTTLVSVDAENIDDVSRSGLMMRLENGLKDLDSRLASTKATLLANEKQIKESDERIGQKFEYQDSLEEKRKRRAEIVAELEAQDRENSGVSENIHSEVKAEREEQSPAKVASINDELSEKLGDGMAAMIDAGVVEIITPDQVAATKGERYSDGGKVQGITTPTGKVYLVQGNIKQGNAWGVLLHELGVHAGKMLHGDNEFRQIKNSIERRKSENSPTGEAIRKAFDRVPKNTKQEHVMEEVIAYLVENNPDVTLVRRIIAIIKRALVKAGLSPDIFSAMDFSALAEMAVRKETRDSKRFLDSLYGAGVKSDDNNSKIYGGYNANTGRAGSLHTEAAFRESRSDKKADQGVGQDRQESGTGGDSGANGTKRPRNVTSEDLNSDAFKNFFGRSTITHEDGSPRIFYFGSKEFGTKDDPRYWTLGAIEGQETGSPMRGLGYFSAQSEIDAQGYSRGTGNVHGFYIRLENPLRMKYSDLPAFREKSEAVAFAKRQKELNGYDGIYFTDEDHVVIFDKNQAKSAEQNTGDFSLENDDTRYSIADDSPVSLQSLEAQAKTIGSIKYIKRSKVDSTFLDRVFSTPEYYFKKFAAAGRVLQAALLRRDLRFSKEQEILGGFVRFVQDLRKKDKVAYTEANDYLIDADQTGEGFRIRAVDDNIWKVIDREGKTISEVEAKEDTDESRMEAEKIAVAKMIDEESLWMRGNGFSPAAIKAVRMARELTNRGFDVMAADMRRIIKEAKENGLPDPFTADAKKLDEAGRYGVYEKGKKKPIAVFATEAEAEAMVGRSAEMYSHVAVINGKASRRFASKAKALAWKRANSGEVMRMKTFQNLTVKKRSDEELRPLTVKQALAQMGDLRGIYFPRIRESGEYVLIARKEGANPIRKSFDIPAAADGAWTITKLMNSVTPMGREAKALKLKGYDVSIRRDESPSEDIFEATNLVTSLDSILSSSLASINKNDKAAVNAGQHIEQILTLQAADIFKARGYLSSRMKRLASDEVWEGYEEDMGKALTQYGKNVAAGTAKRETARAMVLAFSGRDYSWEDYKQEVDNPDWTEYSKIVEERRIHEGKQKNLYGDVRRFMIDVLRNDEQVDRIIGTMKGLAVLKFLGFRVSSAAVNATNMVHGVPATIAGHTGESIHDALGRVISAATAYGKYRLGKSGINAEDRAIFEKISALGWDEAQFNHDAASELRSKMGDAWNKFMTASMWMFGAVEKTNRACTIFAAIKAVRDKNPKMNEALVWEKAKEISDRAHGVYGKETLPAWVRGRFNPLRLTYTFNKFTHNYMLNAYDMGVNKKEYAATAWLILSPAITAGAGATIATPVLVALAGALGIGGDDPEEEFYKWAEETFGTDAYVRQGIAGGLFGVNMKGSLSAHMTIPTNLEELGGAPWAVLGDIYEGTGNLFKGEYAKGIERLLPTAFGSAIKAQREHSEGITTSNYGSVFYGDEPLKADEFDAFLRFFSFNPARISGIREKQWNEKEVAAEYQSEKTEIYAKIKRLYLHGKGITPEVLKAIAKYNERVEDSGRPDVKPITMKGIRSMLKRNATASKFERMRDTEE